MLSYKSYKILDLTVLIVFGFILEMIMTVAETRIVAQAIPYTVVGLLFVTLAVVRWRYVGLITIPFYVLANFLAGRFFGGTTGQRDELVKQSYDFVKVLAGFISYFAILYIPLLFKRRKKKGFVNIKDVFKNVSIVVVIYIVALGILEPMFKFIQYGGLYLNEYRLCWETILIYQALAAIITILLSGILYKQNTLIDVKDSLLQKKNEKKYEREYYTKLSKETKEALAEASDRKESEHHGNDQR